MKRENILTKKIAQNLTEAIEGLDNFKEAYTYIESDLKEEDKSVLLEFCTWCYEKKFDADERRINTVEILWPHWIKETTPEDKFKIVKSKTSKKYYFCLKERLSRLLGESGML